MSGAELALAIVPLVIVLIEHHRTVFTRGKALISPKNNNAQQLDFHQELHGELCLLKTTLNRVEVTATRVRLGGIQPNRPLIESIEIRLGKDADSFQLILDHVLKSINDLVREESSALTQDDTDNPRAMLQKLRRFEQMISNGEAPNSIRARFRFARNERTRRVAMRHIHDGVKTLERLLNSSAEIFDYQNGSNLHKVPDTRTRRFPEDLFVRLADKWSCACSTRHLARLCLWNCCCTSDNRGDLEVSLDIIISMSVNEQGSPQWQESTIHVTQSQQDQLNKNTLDDTRPRLADIQAPSNLASTPMSRNIDSQSLCGLLRRARISNKSLQISFKDGMLWQQRPILPRLQICDQLDASLKSLLENTQEWHRWKLRDKTILAVVLAHTVMHCSEGPWLHAELNKEHIFFFRKSCAQPPDLSRPFLAIDFAQQNIVANEEDDMFPIHSNPFLLSLGIVLLEINRGILIEDYWSQKDLTNGLIPNDSTNLTAALRLLEDMDGHLVNGSQKAVKACLQWDNMNYGREHEDFAKRMYELVVKPLEEVLLSGFNITPEQLGLTERQNHRG